MQTPQPVYSPTSTDDWSFCPYYWRLRQDGWRRTEHDTRDVSKFAGTAFAAGMAAHHTGFVPASAAKTVFVNCINAVPTWTPDVTQAFLDTTLTHLLNALDYTIKHDPLPTEWGVEAVEQPLCEQAGRARPDVIFRNTATKQRLVRDYKFKLQLDTKWEQKTLREYNTSTQANHYLHFTGADFFQAFIVVATPKVRFVGAQTFVERDELALTRWATSQHGKWLVMDMQKCGTLPMWENNDHANRYGECLFKEVCVTFNRDTTLMKSGGYMQEARDQ